MQRVRTDLASEAAFCDGPRQVRYDDHPKRLRREDEDGVDGIGREKAVGLGRAAELLREERPGAGGRESEDDLREPCEQAAAHRASPAPDARRAGLHGPIKADRTVAHVFVPPGGYPSRVRVLVTGGGGFLGSHLVARLREEGLDPFVARRRDYDLTVAADVERMYADASPELVFHLAAEVGGIGANRANPGRYWYANLMMGVHVIEQSRVPAWRRP